MKLPKVFSMLFIIYCVFIFLNPAKVYAVNNLDTEWQFVYISDTHLGFAKTNNALDRFSKELDLLKDKYAFLVHTGDVTEIGTKEAFMLYKQKLSTWGLPAYTAIGNHDVRWSPSGKKLYQEFFGPAYYSFNYNGIHFIVLDTTIVHQTHGHINEEQLEWLAKDIADIPNTTPIFVFSHHPVRWTGISIDNGYKVVRLLDKFYSKIFFHGHSHNVRVQSWNGAAFVQNGALFNNDYMVVKIINIDNVKKVIVEAKTLGDTASKRTVAEIPLETKEFKPNAMIFQKEEITNDVRQPKEIWKKNIGEVYVSPVISKDLVVSANIYGKIIAFEQKTGVLWWKFGATGGIYASPLIIENAIVESVFVATDEGKIYRLSLISGKVEWERDLGSSIYGGISSSESALFCNTGSGDLIALSIEDGKILWKTTLAGFTQGVPQNDGSQLFLGVWGNKFYSIEQKTGNIIWQKRIGKSFYYSPGIATPYLNNDKVIVPAKDNQLYAYNKSNGNLLWSIPVSAGYSSPSGKDGVVYLATQQGKVIAIDEKTGKQKWEVSFGTPFYESSPVIIDDYILISSLDGNLYLLSDKDGTIKWKYNMSRGYVIGTPVVRNGYIWVGSMDGTLYCLKL